MKHADLNYWTCFLARCGGAMTRKQIHKTLTLGRAGAVLGHLKMRCLPAAHDHHWQLLVAPHNRCICVQVPC